MESKLVQGAKQIQEFAGRWQIVRANENLERHMTLAVALARRDDPTRAEIHTFVESWGDYPEADMQESFVLLRSLEKAAEMEPGPAAEGLGSGPGKPQGEEQEWKAARLRCIHRFLCRHTRKHTSDPIPVTTWLGNRPRFKLAEVEG